MIETLVTDIDGVMTDGSFYYTEEGKMMKKFGAHDNDGIKMLRKGGVKIQAITADKRGFAITKKRLDDMNIPVELVSEADRLKFIKINFGFDTTAFVGDGYHDADCLRNSRLGFAPLNAVPHAKANANVVTTTSGGHGVLLEVALFILAHNEQESTWQ